MDNIVINYHRWQIFDTAGLWSYTSEPFFSSEECYDDCDRVYFERIPKTATTVVMSKITHHKNRLPSHEVMMYNLYAWLVGRETTHLAEQTIHPDSYDLSLQTWRQHVKFFSLRSRHIVSRNLERTYGQLLELIGLKTTPEIRELVALCCQVFDDDRHFWDLMMRCHPEGYGHFAFDVLDLLFSNVLKHPRERCVMKTCVVKKKVAN